jgi:purine-binding chemotaxis protein CheW
VSVADASASPAPAAPAAAGVHVRLQAGAEGYAIPVAEVVTVLEMDGVTPVLGAPPALLGLRPLRGTLLPVFDLAAVLGIAPGTAQRIVVVADGTVHAGFAVDDVLDVAELAATDDAAESDCLRGSVLVDGALVGVLDVAALIARLTTELGA